jgi:NADH-quinone oxidoreductase subunit F
MVKSLLRLSYFYQHESCGQCTPCREGTGWLWRVLDRIEHGKGRADDLALLDSVAFNIKGRTICALGDAAAMPVEGMLKHFRDEFAHHIEHKTCLVAHPRSASGAPPQGGAASGPAEPARRLPHEANAVQRN